MTEEGSYTYDIKEYGYDENGASIKFEVDRDEAFNYNYMWLNWGILDNSTDDNIRRVIGKEEPFYYYNEMSFSDYYDRSYIFLIFLISFVGSLFPIFGIPV